MNAASVAGIAVLVAAALYVAWQRFTFRRRPRKRPVILPARHHDWDAELEQLIRDGEGRG